MKLKIEWVIGGVVVVGLILIPKIITFFFCVTAGVCS